MCDSIESNKQMCKIGKWGEKKSFKKKNYRIKVEKVSDYRIGILGWMIIGFSHYS